MSKSAKFVENRLNPVETQEDIFNKLDRTPSDSEPDSAKAIAKMLAIRRSLSDFGEPSTLIVFQPSEKKINGGTGEEVEVKRDINEVKLETPLCASKNMAIKDSDNLLMTNKEGVCAPLLKCLGGSPRLLSSPDKHALFYSYAFTNKVVSTISSVEASKVDMCWAILGYFTRDEAVLNPKNDRLVFSNVLDTDFLMDSLAHFRVFPKLENNKIIVSGSNILDLMSIVFSNTDAQIPSVVSKYNDFTSKINSRVSYDITFFKMKTGAVEPFKTNFSDAGYDLTVVNVSKKIDPKTTLYGTGISVDISLGWYTEIVPRSSLIKSGYILTNSVGIIDNSYTGELLISLTKINEDSPDIALPFRCCQLIVRKQYFCGLPRVLLAKPDQNLAQNTQELKNNDFISRETSRSNKGFGSTN